MDINPHAGQPEPGQNLREGSHTWVYPELDQLRFMKARFVQRAFQPHFHEYFVFGIIESGVQSFSYGTRYLETRPGSVIALNPQELHTGEPVNAQGYAYRAFYPSAELLERITREFSTKPHAIPCFSGGKVPDKQLYRQFRQLHTLSEYPGSQLELEERLYKFLVTFIQRHAGGTFVMKDYRKAPRTIHRAVEYLEAHYAQKITLADLSALTHVSMYHLARLFQRQMGVPPHRYLECVRIRRAEEALSRGMPVVEAALACGFSSQTHLTRTFRKVIGTTPGEYKTAKLYKT